jgi:hypothetical protein
MSKINNQSRKSSLALALAGGGTVTAWARENQIPERTAYTWSRSPEVLEQVEMIRREAIDRAIGRLSDSATVAAAEIARLVKEGETDTVKLQAARAVLADLMSVSNYAALEKRLVEVERRMREGSQSPVAGSQPDPAAPTRLATGGSHSSPTKEAQPCPAC